MNDAPRSAPQRLLFSALVLALAGCSDSLEVHGRVKYDGKPVENGVITFEPEDRNGPSRGQAIADGEYHLTGPNRMTPGLKVVRIQAFRPTGRKVSAAPGSKQMVDEMGQYIPPQYNVRSTIKVAVEAGKSNEFDFDLRRDN